MTDCAVCSLIKGKTGTLFENEKIAVILAPRPAVKGHLWIAPKTHASILEQVPEDTVAEMFSRASSLSTIVFAGMHCEGTNVLVQNGVAAGQHLAHTVLNVIPRFKDDNIPLAWRPKQYSEEEIGAVELLLKEEINRKEETRNDDSQKEENSASNSSASKEIIEIKEEQKGKKETHSMQANFADDLRIKRLRRVG